MLPVPIGKPARFHLESIRRYMPKAYWIRVNGQFIAFQSDKALANILRKVDYKYLRLKRYMRNYLNYRQPKGEKNITQLQERNLSGNVMEAVRDLLSSDDSFSLRLFNRHELDLLFAENTFYSKQSLDILGHLIAMERWLNMIKLVKQQAQSIH